MQRMNAVFRSASSTRPLGTAACTGFCVMAVGDAVAQRSAGGKQFDPQRKIVSAAYNGLASTAFYRWYQLMDRLAPGVAMRTLVPKVLASQLVTTGLNNPCYLLWCNVAEAACGTADWAAVRSRRRLLADRDPTQMATRRRSSTSAPPPLAPLRCRLQRSRLQRLPASVIQPL